MVGQNLHVQNMLRTIRKLFELWGPWWLSVIIDNYQEKQLNTVIREVPQWPGLVESKKRPISIIQCYNCLEYGHVQFCCTTKAVCTFCADSHPSKDGPRLRGKGSRAICTLCSSNHQAFFRSCLKHLENIRIVKDEEKKKRVKQSQVEVELSIQPFISVYLPPTKVLNEVNFRKLIEHPNTIIGGDWNAKNRTWGCRSDNRNGRTFASIIKYNRPGNSRPKMTALRFSKQFTSAERSWVFFSLSNRREHEKLWQT